jgi:hypothetical protein
VTIAAGYVFNGGVILCADTQETVGLSKTKRPKLVIEPRELEGKDSPEDLMLAMAGAGDGPYIDKLVERVWKKAKAAQGFEEACALVETSIQETYEYYLGLFHPGQMPYSDVVYGVKMEGRSKLFRATGPIVNETPDYCSVGNGYYLAEFITDRVYRKRISGPQAIILAAYVLFQCKEHVDGCGGESHIAGLYNAGASGRIKHWDVHLISSQAERVDLMISELLLTASDFTVGEVEFSEVLQFIVDELKQLRAEGRQTKHKRRSAGRQDE